MSIKARRRAFLNKTIKYYNITNRGVGKNGCSYEAGCAIGRFLPKELCDKLDHASKVNGSVSIKRVPKELWNEIPFNIRELGREFLGNVQNLHDIDYYWNNTGLTESGLDCVKVIKAKYGL